MPKILLVEDNILTKSTIARFLRDEGFDVDEVAEGGSALSLLERQRYDLILSDIAMPLVNGFDLLDRATSIAPGIPVILITAYDTLQSQAASRGAADLILKPFLLDDLLSKIQLALAVKDTK